MNTAENNSLSVSQAKPKYCGIGPAMCDDRPTPDELMLTADLDQVLRSNDMYATDDEVANKFKVLYKIKDLFEKWVREIIIARNIPEGSSNMIQGMVCTFGSFRLGMIMPGSDIDTLCVVAKSIERTDFFTTFYDILKKHEEVQEIKAIPEAFVPLIRLTFDGVDMDLLFARVALTEIPENLNLRDDQILRGMDPKCIMSLNGRRVTDEISELVPNYEAFKMTSRTIKLWAKKRGVYSNMTGFLGGASWMILVARICQLHPNATPAVLVHQFFSVYSKWNWPIPIALKTLINPDIEVGIPSWYPKYDPSNRPQVMPIITPCFPYQNSSYNVSYSTKEVLMKEFQRGWRITEGIIEKTNTWEVLFETSNIFKTYRHFLVVRAGASTKEELRQWSGYVESKLRHLVLRLETNKAVQNIHINPNTYGAKDSDLAVQWFFGFSIKKNENQKIRIDLSDNIQDFFDYLYDSAGSTFKEGMTTDFKYFRKSQLSECLDAKVLPPTRKRTERKNNETTNEREALLETINFFSDYKHFVVVRAKAPTKEELHEWTEHVESKLGNLVIQLKNNDVVQNTYMNPKSYEVKHFDLTVQWFLGFQMKKPVGKKIDLSDAIQNFSDNLYGSAGSAFKQGMTTEFRYIKRNQLSECLDAEILQPTGKGTKRKREETDLPCDDDEARPPMKKNCNDI